MEWLLYALVGLIGSVFFGLIVAAWMRRNADDDGTYGAPEGRWRD